MEALLHFVILPLIAVVGYMLVVAYILYFKKIFGEL
jgi:hypothetical protein